MHPYHSVGNRCYVDFPALDLPVDQPRALQLLADVGFEIEDLDISSIGRATLVGARYLLHARMSQAPNYVDCCSFTKWLFGLKGMKIPRLPIQQYRFGRSVGLAELQAEDLIFTSSRSRRAHCAHVVMYTGTSVISAIPKVCIERGERSEMSLEELWSHREFRGACRIGAHGGVTLKIPPRYAETIESSDDIKYLVLSLAGSD